MCKCKLNSIFVEDEKSAINWFGKLKIVEEVKSIKYGIFVGGKFLNLSRVLFDIYKYEKNVITIKIKNEETNEILLNEKGNLTKSKIANCIYTYSINNIDIEDILLNLEDKYKIRIEIKVLKLKAQDSVVIDS